MEPEECGSRKAIGISGRALAAVLMAGLVGLSQAACEGGSETDAAAGGDEPEGGVVQAYLMDGGSGAAAPSSSARTVAAEPGSDQMQGSFRGNFIVSVYSEDGFWVDLGRHAQMTIPLRTTSPRALVEGEGVPPGTYTRVRVLVCHSSADVAPGSRIGKAALDRKANVHLTETGDIFIIRDVEPFRVTPDRAVQLDIDLNSPGWITEQAVESGAASIPTFEKEVRVKVRSDGP